MALGSYEKHEDAQKHAQRLADDMGRTTCIEKIKEYGLYWRFNVGLIPVDPAKRFGRDARVEAVHPTTADASYWALQGERTH